MALTREEFLQFLGVVLAMGIIRLPEIRDYWSTDSVLNFPFFRSNFARDRFEDILRFLHVVDNQQAPHPRPTLYKIQPMIDLMLPTFKAHWKPTFSVAVDEGMVPFTGRISFLQYMKDKPVKWGIKIWKLCDQASYLYTFDVYTGKRGTEKLEGGLGFQVVKKLVCQLPESLPRHVFADNFFASVALAEELLHGNMLFTGTIKSNRQGFPSEVGKAVLRNQGDSIWRMKAPGILALKWKDSKEVNLISTAHLPNIGQKEKRQKVPGGKIVRNFPEAIASYISGMGSVDRHNQNLSYYDIDRRHVKW